MFIKNTKYLYIKFFLIIISISSITTGNSVFDKLEGNWAAEKWYWTLMKTKSPSKAAKTVNNYMSHLFFKKKSDAFYMDIVFNCFHEGAGDIPFTKIRKIKNEQYELIVSDFNNPNVDLWTIATVEFLDTNRIKLTSNCMMGTSKTEFFIKVKPALNEFVNQTILAGRYKDNSGKEYIFSNNGEVNWDGELMRYEIILDYVTNAVNWFTLSNGNYYGFKIEDSKLLIYNLRDSSEGIGFEKIEPPYLILYKTTKIQHKGTESK